MAAGIPCGGLRRQAFFELFIPGIRPGACYKYEIKTKSGLPMLKADPYANAAELRPNTASIVTDLSGFEWTDGAWLEKRKKTDYKKEPLLVYEVHLGSWRKPEQKRTARIRRCRRQTETGRILRRMGMRRKNRPRRSGSSTTTGRSLQCLRNT